jgi:hypothetical protein
MRVGISLCEGEPSRTLRVGILLCYDRPAQEPSIGLLSLRANNLESIHSYFPRRFVLT